MNLIRKGADDNWVVPLGTAIDLIIILAIVGLITGNITLLAVLAVVVSIVCLAAKFWNRITGGRI